MHYVMVYPHNEFTEIIFSDLLNQPHVSSVRLRVPSANKLVNDVRRIHTSHKLRKLVKLPFQDIWAREIPQKTCPGDCLIFWITALPEVSLEFLRKVRHSQPGVKMVLLLWDSLHGNSPLLPEVWLKIFDFKWDLVVSFDREDCREFGFVWIGQSYYSRMTGLTPVGEKSDIYYVGNDRGRSGRLLAIYRHLQAAGVRCNFCLCKEASLKKRLQMVVSRECGTEYDRDGLKIGYQDKPYKQVLQELLKTNCILELLQSGQHTQTVRYFEAVCYNKKFLTNNKGIVDLPYYDARFMRIIDGPEDIDIDWVMKREDVDYGYRGEFSPANILGIVEEHLGKGEESC